MCAPAIAPPSGRLTHRPERVLTLPNLSPPLPVLLPIFNSTAKAQNVWALGYVDAIVLHDRDANVAGGGLDERLYAQYDANFNVTSVTDAFGAVVERYLYDAYGAATYLDGDWAVDAGGSDYAWAYLHQGGRLDATTGNYHLLNRDLSPIQGRWMSTDPERYQDGLNLYQSFGASPALYVDPLGTVGQQPSEYEGGGNVPPATTLRHDGTPYLDSGRSVGRFNGWPGSIYNGMPVFRGLDSDGKPTGEYWWWYTSCGIWVTADPFDVEWESGNEEAGKANGQVAQQQQPAQQPKPQGEPQKPFTLTPQQQQQVKEGLADPLEEAMRLALVITRLFKQKDSVHWRC